ncbi:MAG: S41 family peptidase [Bacteroidota bacterium]
MRFIFLLLCCGLQSLIAQNATYPKAQLAHELDRITQVMETYHPNAYHYVDSVALRNLRNALTADLPDQMAPVQAYRQINQYVCAFGDGHTRVWDRQHRKTFIENGGLEFPYAVKIKNVDYIEAITPTGSQQMLAINGIPAADIVTTLRRHASRETTALDDFLVSRNFPYYLWLAYGWEGTFMVEWRIGGRSVTEVIEGISPLDRPQASSEEPTVSFQVLDNQIAYLKVAHFEKGLAYYRKKYAEAFALFREADAQALIIDVRNHDGGDQRAGEELARYFAKTPFRSFAYSEWKATPKFKKVFKDVYIPKPLHWALPLFKGLNPHTKAIYNAADHANARVEYKLRKPLAGKRFFDGPVTLLMDQNTFSAGTCFAAMFKDYEMGTIIGQESGSLANFHADGLLRMQIKDLDLVLQISNSYLVRPSGEETPQPVQPDVYLSPELDALAHALQLARK